MPVPAISIIIPVLNDSQSLEQLLEFLRAIVDSAHTEIIVVDGGSADQSVEVASAYGVRVLRSATGRGLQLSAGYRAAQGSYLWFLHADTQPTEAAVYWLLTRTSLCWGRFDICFDDESLPMWLTASMMNGRSSRTGICTGDQGIFAHRRLLEVIGGVPEQPLMEDIELSCRLNRLCQPQCPGLKIQSSARRWQKHGWGRTVLAMWRYRLRYWGGTEAAALARDYYPGGPA